MPFKRKSFSMRKRTLTPAEEIFCQALYAGKTQVDAYLEAGYVVRDRRTASVRACELRKVPHVADRLAALRNALATRQAIEVKEALAEFGRARKAPGDSEIEELRAELRPVAVVTSPVNEDDDEDDNRELIETLDGYFAASRPELTPRVATPVASIEDWGYQPAPGEYLITADGVGEIDPGDLVGDVLTRIGRARAVAKRRMRVLQIVEARAKDADILAAPGGYTGFVTLDIKNKEKVSMVDRGLLSALLDMEQHIARELGQWIERADETVTVKGLEDLDDAAIENIIRDARELAAREGIALPALGAGSVRVVGEIGSGPGGSGSDGSGPGVQ